MDNSSAALTLWFDNQNLVEQVDYQTWTRGQTLFLHSKVLRHEVRRDGVSWLVTGTVQGTQVTPYTVQVELTLDPKNRLLDWHATCSCPVGEGCKHAVALTLKAGTSGLRVGGTVVPAQTGPTGQPSPMARMEVARQLVQEIQAQQAEGVADQHLLDWLGKLQATQARVAQAPIPSRGRIDRFLYRVAVETHQGRPRLQLNVSSAYLKASGTWSKPTAVRYEPSPGNNVYDQASDADRQVLQLMRSCKSAKVDYTYGHNYTDTVWPVGELGLMLLRQAASTGRLFFETNNGHPDEALHWGEPEPLQWRWTKEGFKPPALAAMPAQPGWRLRAELRRDGLQLCENEPPLYLDTECRLLGEAVAVGFEPTQLMLLMNAPVLAASALKKHAEPWMELMGQLPIPPVLPPAEPLRGVVPVP